MKYSDFNNAANYRTLGIILDALRHFQAGSDLKLQSEMNALRDRLYSLRQETYDEVNLMDKTEQIDAARYRYLRKCSPALSNHHFRITRDNFEEGVYQGYDTLWGDALDVAVDSSIGNTK